MLEESIENITKSDSLFAPIFVKHCLLPDVNFNGHCLINNISIHKKALNLYISYILNPWLRNLKTDLTLNNYLFGSAELTENADPGKYKYSSYDIGFDSRSKFSFTDNSFCKNIFIFVVDMSSSVYIDTKNKNI